jgi:hypothetical protein
LQVGAFNEITVNDSQTPDPCTRQHLNVRRPERAAADDDDTRRAQTRLTFHADWLKQNLPTVTF